jgi:DNA-directed RNA polymerase specialized sigma24 family protein
MMSKVEPSLCDRSRSSPLRPPGGSRQELWPHLLSPDRLDHIDQLYRTAWALCGAQHDAEDLRQETSPKVVTRPRVFRDDSELGYLHDSELGYLNDNELRYLLWALKNTCAARCRTAARRSVTRQLPDDYALPTDSAEAMTTTVATMRPAEAERAQVSRQHGAPAERAEQVPIVPPTAHPASASAIGDARTW